MGRAGGYLDGYLLPLEEATGEGFSDTKFMSATEKTQVFKAWVRFLDSNFLEKRFTKALYHHLYQHCGHIAHMNRYGFYHTWFASGSSRQQFIDKFLFDYLERESGSEDYLDINRQMALALLARRGELEYGAKSAEREQLLAERAAIDARLAAL